MAAAGKRAKRSNISDRGLRYRANAIPPPGEKRCCLCGTKRTVEVGHVNGHEEDTAPQNLFWTCRSCNVKSANTLRKAGLGRATVQFNPKSHGAESLGQWVNAVTSMKGESTAMRAMSVPAAVEMIRATPASARSRYAKQIWRLRRHQVSGKRNPLPLALVESGETTILSPYQKQVSKEAKKLQKKLGLKLNKGKRKNPPAESQEAYQGFHGRPSDKWTKVTTPIKEHVYLAALGDLIQIDVITPKGFLVKIKKFDSDGPAILSMNEHRTQLYIDGGDQRVDLAQFGIKGPIHESEVLGEVKAIRYYTTKDHLGSEGGEAVYDHKFSKPRPSLLYDTRNGLLSFSGGKYTIPDEGIDN